MGRIFIDVGFLLEEPISVSDVVDHLSDSFDVDVVPSFDGRVMLEIKKGDVDERAN